MTHNSAKSSRAPQSFRATHWHEGIAECQERNEGISSLMLLPVHVSTLRRVKHVLNFTATR